MTILIVEPDRVYAKRLLSIVERYDETVLTATVTSAIATIDRTRYLSALVLADIFRDESGLEIRKHGKRRLPSPPFLFVRAGNDEYDCQKDSRSSSSRSYLFAEEDQRETIVRFISRSVASMRQAAEITGQIVRRFARQYKLSARETEVIDLAISGLPRRNIARLACVSEQAVKWRIKSLLKKCGAATLDDVVHTALLDFILALSNSRVRASLIDHRCDTV